MCPATLSAPYCGHGAALARPTLNNVGLELKMEGRRKQMTTVTQVWAEKGGTKGMPTDGRQALASCLLSTP